MNTGSKEALLLTNDFPREYNAHISSKTVAAGDTIYLRWKFNPFSKGRFNDNVTLWFSTMQKPIDLKISGNVTYIDKYANPACPNFNERPAGQERTFDTDFRVVEKGSLKPISKSNITIVDNGIVLGKFQTDRNGEKSLRLPIRYYYFYIEAEGYESTDLYSYVNSKHHRFTFELNPIIEEEPAVQEEIAEVIQEEPEELQEPEEPEVQEVIEEPEITEAVKNDKPMEAFDSRMYAPNNIVFLVDVSGSMASNGRLDILKSSMIDMVNMMRPEDNISLVSYARNTNVLLEPTSGDNKTEIIKQIRLLKAQGATSGERGLKKAYAVAKSAFIEKGNNRVYIATDGVFKVSEVEPIEKLVKKNTRRNIYLSVLGIKGTEFTKKKMSELALMGRGEFVALEDFDDSGEKLKNLIKLQSKK